MNTQMDTMEKLRILSDAAKYDAACTSSGVNRAGVKGQLGSAAACGICHSFASDGRCISLLKVLMTNICAYDCTYCLNRRSNDTPRATFRPQELADLTISFYRRNYIEGLFLSSAVFGSPDITCERMLETLHILRNEYHFNGYIHVKAIPGADETLLQQLGLLADRMSVNIELPSNDSLKRLAPQKSKENILLPMSRIRDGIKENAHDLIRYKSAPRFVPGGQSTQMIIGATPENDRRILQLSEGLYHKYSLKRVFYSAYIPVVQDRNMPELDTEPPLLRERYYAIGEENPYAAVAGKAVYTIVLHGFSGGEEALPGEFTLQTGGARYTHCVLKAASENKLFQRKRVLFRHLTAEERLQKRVVRIHDRNRRLARVELTVKHKLL